MKTLIVEDDFSSRLVMQQFLKSYGSLHVAVNGREAIEAVRLALDAGEPYNLICLDIMMPEVDGHQALKQIRSLEESKGILSTHGSKIIMTSALGNVGNVSKAYYSLCDAYLVKPIERKKLLVELRRFGLIP